MTSKQFFELLYGDEISEKSKLSIFTLPDKKVQRFLSAGDAAKYVGDVKESQDVYFGLGLISGEPKGRGKLEDIAGIPGLWLDIDIGGKGHKKKRLPKLIEDAEYLVTKFPLAPTPTLAVHSGGGVHVYWLFKEFWRSDSKAERAEAALLSARFGETFKIIAAKQGYEIDTVSDLTRVLRVVGTHNLKHESRPEVKDISRTDIRYTADDFDQYLIDGNAVALPSKTYSSDGVVLSAGAEPPADKMFALLENDPQFKRSWNQTRTDMADSSPSAYDASLASIAVLAGWGDQEIANLIIANRRKHKQDMIKAMRWDYIKRTLALARSNKQSEADDIQDAITAKQQEQAIKTTADEASQVIAENKTVDPIKRQLFLTSVSTTLGVKISRWLQHGEENARYSLQLEDGRWVRMGTALEVLSGRVFRSRLYEATRHLIKNLKQKVWDDVCKNLAAAAEVVENEEVTSGYRAGQWVDSYLQDHPLWQGEWQQAMSLSEPFKDKEGSLMIHAGELRKHMKMVQGERQVSHVELCDSLRVAGFRRRTMSAWKDGTAISRSYWSRAEVLDSNSPLYREMKKQK